MTIDGAKKYAPKPATCPWCGVRLRTFSPDGFESKRCRVESANHYDLTARIRAQAKAAAR